MNHQFQICSRCILDTNDYPEITFDSEGVCSVCHIYEDLALKTVKRGNDAEKAMDANVVFASCNDALFPVPLKKPEIF